MAKGKAVKTVSGEKFSATELGIVQSELIQGGLDPWQAAELLQVFCAGRGYGASCDAARIAAGRVAGSGYEMEVLRAELEGLAQIM